MHEFILHSQVPAARHDQVLNILSSYTAMPPVSVYDQTLIYAQRKLVESSLKRKQQQHAVNQGGLAPQLQYRKLVRDLHVPADGAHDGTAGPWTLRAEELPQAGIMTVTSRPVHESPIEAKELEKFREGGENYKYVNQFLAQGHRFIHNNIIVRLTRILTVPEGTGALEPLDAPVPHLPDCRPLDPSGAYLVEVSVRVADSSQSEVVATARSELDEFRKAMEGAIDLKIPSRLSMDPRVKG
ncbi:Med18 protein [Teratosphaeria destructans]|uniref:Mediator of RNA polymerase II transcription subunit 18 n=1 Tax=Teratosphaeria destructans TaxID=418781 RepID=A0A9W7VXL8_9PEZI|nr:Med18 protein [Teratosphaeria destructans]